MTDSLRTRIAGVLGGHIEDQLTNYDAGRNECGCGQQGNATYRDHVADAVIRELNLAKACAGGCMWQIPNRFEDMTPQQRENLERMNDERL